jgi:hypothetical protein
MISHITAKRLPLLVINRYIWVVDPLYKSIALIVDIFSFLLVLRQVKTLSL